jgi:hypothetical protein
MAPPEYVTTAQCVEFAATRGLSTTQEYWRERAKAGDLDYWFPSPRKFLITLESLERFLAKQPARAS